MGSNNVRRAYPFWSFCDDNRLKPVLRAALLVIAILLAVTPVGRAQDEAIHRRRNMSIGVQAYPFDTNDARVKEIEPAIELPEQRNAEACRC